MVNKNTFLRIARATNYLELISNMYKNGLGLKELGRFKDHSGFDGIILGHKNCIYHFEFTTHQGSTAVNNTNKDNLIVYYIIDNFEWETTCRSMSTAGFKIVKSFNPYWDNSGKTFEDLEGYRVVLQNEPWD
jgi:hypothetical protein